MKNSFRNIFLVCLYLLRIFDCIYLHVIYFIVIYSRTPCTVYTVMCWLYLTWNEFYLILFFKITFVYMRDIHSSGYDHLCQIWKESIQMGPEWIWLYQNIIASQNTGNSTACSIACPVKLQRKHESSVLLIISIVHCTPYGVLNHWQLETMKALCC